MRKLVKSIAFRFLRALGTWLTNEKNLPRLRVVQEFFERAAGHPTAVCLAQQKYPGLIFDQSKKARLRNFQQKFYSQFSEDGLIMYFLDRIGAPNKTFIEFGIEDGTECNAAHLAINFGWKGLFIEGDPEEAERARHFYHKQHPIDPEHVKIKNHFITLENVNDLFKQHGFEGEIDLLSIDIDGVDYYVWEAINVIQPRMVITEYNAVFGRDRSLTVPYDPKFDRDDFHSSGICFGMSLKAANKLAEKKGYVLVGCESSGSNAFFVRKDLAEAAKVDTFTPEEAFYPCRPRLRTQTQDEQWETVKDCKLVEI